MPQSVTHFLIPLILLGLFQDIFVKKKKTFPIHYVFIGGLAGLIPDLDIAVYYLLSFFGFEYGDIHRTFLHTLFVPLFFLILAISFHSFKTKMLGKHHLKLKNIFLVIAFGVLIHLILDATIDGGIMPFYPLSSISLGLNLIRFFPSLWQNTIISVIDAGLLILWIIYLEVKHKISDVI